MLYARGDLLLQINVMLHQLLGGNISRCKLFICTSHVSVRLIFLLVLNTTVAFVEAAN
jgi:hypothetical protein